MCFKTIGKRVIAICLAAAMLAGCGKADIISEKPAGGINQEDYITEISEDNKNKEPADAEISSLAEADFTGEWTRTNVHSSQGADITIENADSEGFDFSGTFYYYYHMGDVAGRAVYTSPSEAEYKQSEEDDIDGEPAYIRFSVDDQGLHITSEGFVEGLGANVVVDGDYVKGEAAYTNANVMEENFSEKDLEEIKKILPEETYDDDFKTNSELGNVTSEDATLADGTKARHIECFVPTAGEGYDMLITEDGRYYYCDLKGEGFATNDTGYQGQELPEYTVVE